MELETSTYFPVDPLTMTTKSTSDASSFLESEGSVAYSTLEMNMHMMPIDRFGLDFLPDVQKDCSAIVCPYLASRAGACQTLSEVPENHRFLRPDDTIHIHLRPSRSIIVLLSGLLEAPQQLHSRWLGQFNGREEFKVTHLRHHDSQQVYRLAITANSSWLEYRVAMSTPLVSINGHLGINIHEGIATQLALSLPQQCRPAPRFNVAVSLIPLSPTCWQKAPSYLTLQDCLDPVTFTLQHARSRIERSSGSYNSTYHNLSGS